VASSADALGHGFHEMDDTFHGMSRDLDLRIGNGVEIINGQTKEIASLNDAIMTAESRGETPNELYDRRDTAVRDLSQKLDVQVSDDERHRVMVICGGSVLVQGMNQAISRSEEPRPRRASGQVIRMCSSVAQEEANGSLPTGSKRGS